MNLSIVTLPHEQNYTAVPPYSVVVTSSVKTSSILPTSSGDVYGTHHSTSHILAYSFISFGILAFFALVAFVGICIFRRNKLDRIRHHLMPMYNFDATDEEARWEADLLEDDREQQIALNQNISGYNRPKLKFHSHGLEV